MNTAISTSNIIFVNVFYLLYKYRSTLQDSILGKVLPGASNGPQRYLDDILIEENAAGSFNCASTVTQLSEKHTYNKKGR